MLQKFSPALVLAVGLVVGAWILAKAPRIDAANPEPLHISFSVTVLLDEVSVIGPVPQNRTLVLHDLIRVAGSGEYEILVDGLPIFPKFILSTQDPHASFVEGFHIRGGRVLACRRTGLFSSSPVNAIYIGGELR